MLLSEAQQQFVWPPKVLKVDVVSQPPVREFTVALVKALSLILFQRCRVKSSSAFCRFSFVLNAGWQDCLSAVLHGVKL